jgi:two-component sensor histidine kinase
MPTLAAELQASASYLGNNLGNFPSIAYPSVELYPAGSLGDRSHMKHLTWTESNGAEVYAPEKRSFGTRLIETLGKQLKGDVHLTYEPAGFVYAFDVRLASLASPAA